eukprot:c48884_g1_i1 orf=154-420(+)
MGIKYKREAMMMCRKGLRQWRHIWDENRNSWWNGEVLRQRFKLTTKELQLIKRVLEEIPDWFPTNTSITRGEPEIEWQWRNGNNISKT